MSAREDRYSRIKKSFKMLLSHNRTGVGTLIFLNRKLRHCFESNLGETAERRGGARMGLSERYDAILS